MTATDGVDHQAHTVRITYSMCGELYYVIHRARTLFPLKEQLQARHQHCTSNPVLGTE